MKKRIGARTNKYRRRLTEADLARILSRTLPRRNGYIAPNTAELLKELSRFGIANEQQFRRLLLKHRRNLIADDREHLYSRAFLAAVAEDYGVNIASVGKDWHGTRSNWNSAKRTKSMRRSEMGWIRSTAWVESRLETSLAHDVHCQRVNRGAGASRASASSSCVEH